MFIYANYSVRSKLICGFAVLLGLVAVVSWLAILKITDIRGGLNILLENRYQKVKLSNEVIKDASEIGRLVRSAILADDNAEIQQLLQHIDEIRQHNTEILSQIAAIGMRPGTTGYDLFHQAQRARAVLSDKYPPLFKTIRAGDFAAAKAYLNSQWIPANNVLMQELADYVSYNEQAMDTEAEAMKQAATAAMTMLVVATLIAVVLGMLVAWLISADLSRRLLLAKTQAELISAGDLRPPSALTRLSQDEIGQLLAALVQMRSRLADTVSAVMHNAQTLAGSAAHLSLAAEQVAGSSANQAHATSLAAASIEELTVSIDSVASNAGDAHQQAIDAGQLALNSGNAVKTAAREVVSVAASVDDSASSVGHLSTEIRQIDAVTTVIRDVAEQTNLLALNAAIEAARAGEMGRGFAVVAAEVRNLAERTSQSVKQITAMVGAVRHGAAQAVSNMVLSQEKVAQVVQTSDNTTGAIDHIQQAATAVRASVSLISDALSEQRAASVDLAKNLEAISQLSAENMVSVAAVAGTAKELVDTSSQLEQAIRFFKV